MMMAGWWRSEKELYEGAEMVIFSVVVVNKIMDQFSVR